MKKIYELAKKYGVKVEVSDNEITVIGDDSKVWINTGTHDLFVEISEFETKQAAIDALISDMECGREEA